MNYLEMDTQQIIDTLLERDREIQALRKDAERYRDALQAIVGDLEMRSMWKDATNIGVVDCGHSVYMDAKEVLGEADTSIRGDSAAMDQQI